MSLLKISALLLAFVSQVSLAEHEIVTGVMSFEKNDSKLTYKSDNEPLNSFCNSANKLFNASKNLCNPQALRIEIDKTCDNLKLQLVGTAKKILGPNAKINVDDARGKISGNNSRNIEVHGGVGSDASPEAKRARQELIEKFTGSTEVTNGRLNKSFEYEFSFNCDWSLEE